MQLKVLFGKKLKELRELKGLTQQELAELCDLNTTTIGMYEIGKRTPSFSTITVLIEKLEINPSDLFNYDKELYVDTTNEKLISELIKILSSFNTEQIEYFIENAKLIKKIINKKDKK